MATFRQRNGKFQVQIRLKGKRPLSGSFDTISKAKDWAKQQEAALRSNVVVIAPKDTKVTLGEIISKIQYAGTYSTAICHFLSDPISQLSIVSITREDVQRWKTAYPSLKVGTLAKYVNVARMAWDYAQETLELPMMRKNPFAKIGLKKGTKHRERRLKAGEYERIVSNCGPELKEIVDWAIETGMRRGEIAKARFSHFSNDYKFLLISETKTDKPRTIPLSLVAQKIAKKAAASNTTKLFSYSGSRISKEFRRACALGGVQGLTFHDLRHEALSRLNERGLSVYDIMAISGHSTMEQLKIYVQADRERLYTMLNKEGIAA